MFKKCSSLRSLLLLGAASAAAISLSASAYADGNVETVVVTGSRIPTTDINSASPLSVATAAQIEMTKAVNVEDTLLKMIGPDVTGGISNNTENGSVGISEVGLRNLGPNRTLVLVDGQRLIPVFIGAASAPDLSSIPISMVDRIEVLRDGASSVYGADAIGGVINIITKKHENGFSFDGGAGISGQGDGETYSLGGTVGVDTDRSNVTVAFNHDHENGIYEYQRAWSSAIAVNGVAGSAYRSQMNVLQDSGNDLWVGGVQTNVNNQSLATTLPCVGVVPSGRVKLNAACNSPEGPWNSLDGTQSRDQISVNSHYDITPDITAVMSGFYTDRTSGQSLRPEPLLSDTIATFNFPGFLVPASWPGYTTPAHAHLVPCADPAGCISATLTPMQFGPRRYRQQSETYRIRFGFEGHLFGDYNWELGYVKQHNSTDNAYLNEGRWDHLSQITGQTQCIDVPGGCTFSPTFGYAIPTVKPNFFNGPNMFTPQQVAYLTASEHYLNQASEDYFYGDINGPVFDLPAGTVEASVGAERRFEHLSSEPPQLIQDGFGPNASLPTSGGYSVWSVYGELKIPVLKNAPLAESLEVTPSARWDHYSLFGNEGTYKVGVDWQVIDDIRFRGTYSTGIRAPSTAELFGGAGISDVGASGDPCDTRAAGFNGNANIGVGLLGAGKQCAIALAGVPGAETAGVVTNFQPATDLLTNNQMQAQQKGNPALKPEYSFSWNIGLVATPTFLPGFSATADYYEIRIKNSILTGGIVGLTGSPDSILTGCYGPDQNAAYCVLIHRNPSGTITQVDSPNLNFGIQQTKGLDLEASYSTEAASLSLPVPGSFVLDVQAQRQFTNTAQNIDGTLSSFMGTYAGVSIYPNWRGTLSLDYDLYPVTLHWDTQYIEHTVGIAEIAPDIWYNNVSIAYTLPKMDALQSSRLIFGVNNLFDQDPPFNSGDPSACKCNSIAGPYDVVGRFFYTRYTAKF